MTAFKTSTCGGCGAPIVWATTVNGKAMPVDPEPTPDGNVELIELTSQITHRPFTRAIVHAQPPLGAPPLRLPHHATCPKADEFRRR